MDFERPEAPTLIGPLSGIRVVDLTQIYNGPYCTFMMAMAGAEVIKIEPPGGESTRKRQRDAGVKVPHAMMNSGKHFVSLDLKSSEGCRALTKLLKTADVLVENFRPGVMERLGFGKDVLRELNPRLIYASSSGYGSTGPYRDYPAMDLAIQAMAGVMSVTGYEDGPPMKTGASMADFAAGTHLYGAIVTALFERERTGIVRNVEISMFEAVVPTLASGLGFAHSVPRGTVLRAGNRHPGLSIAPYNVYKTLDGFLSLMTHNDAQWEKLAKYWGQDWAATDERYTTMLARVNHIDDVDALVAGWVGQQPTQEVFEGLAKAGVPCAPVRELGDVLEDAHLHGRGALVDIDHPLFGPLTLATSPLVFEGVPRTIRWPSRDLGADNDRYIEKEDQTAIV